MITRRALICLAAALLAAPATGVLPAQPSSTQAATAPAPPASALAHVGSWGYQLQHIDVAALAASPHDALVIDYSRDGGQEAALGVADLDRLKRKPDGSRRYVLAYLSIGEAETYRYYWQWTWGGRWYTAPIGWLLAPSWLGPQNPEWGGNYAVRYWDRRWQEVIVGRDGYLDRIIAAGFDGVWLDKVDSSIEPIARGRAAALDDMRTFVRRIAERGRAARPGFLVVPQNGEELLSDDGYRGVIDALGKEDLLYGEFKDRQANPPDVIARRIELIRPLTAEGKPVLAVEYLDDAAEIAAARRRLTELGFIPHFANRALDDLRIGDLPTPRSTDTARPRRPKPERPAP